MPKRIAVNQIHVFRDKKRTVVKPGELFDFTDEELKDIKAADPDAVRLPVNEGGADPVANAKGAKGGKSTSDDEL